MSKYVKIINRSSKMLDSVKSYDYLNCMFKSKSGKASMHNPIKLKFSNKRFYHKDGTPYVTVVIYCELSFDLPCYWYNGLCYGNCFEVSATAVCAEDDKFDLNKGKLIASAKAENAAYVEANRRLLVMYNELEKFTNVINNTASKLSGFVFHNDKFIEDVANDTFVSKKQESENSK